MIAAKVASLAAGGDERAVWRKPGLGGPPHEVRGAGWGFVHANLDLPVDGEALSAHAAVQRIALPDASGGWSVVGVHYAAL